MHSNIIKYYLYLMMVFTNVISLQSQSHPLITNYYGFGYKALDLFKEAGMNVQDSAYRVLDGIIDDCKKRIVLKDDYPKEEAIKILSTIADVLNENKFKYDSCSDINFSDGLISRKADCRFLTFIYLTIGEILNLPTMSAIAPRHILVGWNNKSLSLFWETTIGRQMTSESYIKDFKILPYSISNGCYLSFLTLNQSYYFVYIELGLYHFNNKKFIEAISSFTKAIALNPRNSSGYGNRGAAKLNLNDFEGASEDYTISIQIDSNNYMDFFNRGITKINVNDFEGALVDFVKASVLYSEDSEVFLYRGIVKGNLMDYNGAINDFSRAIEINPNEARAYYYRGGLHAYYKKQIKEACDDLKKASQLGFKKAQGLIDEYCK